MESLESGALKIHAPVLYPRQIFCAGANYRQHVIDLAVAQGHGVGDTLSLEERRAYAELMMDERIASGSPYVCTKIPSAITGPCDPVVLPEDTAQADWELEQALDEQSITYIIHLAALQLPFVKANPPLGAQVNVVGTVNVFEAIARRKARINRVIYASSAAVYDAADAGTPGAIIQHGAAGHPTSLYGVYKQANEGTARVYWQDYKVSSIGLRPATVYGPGRDQGITSAPTRAMFAAAVGQSFHIPYGGRGEFQYADDVAKTFIACARAPFEGVEIFNLHGSVAHMREVVAAIEVAAPESGGQITFVEPGFPSPEEFDAGPLVELIGPLPHTPLPDAVATTIALFHQKVASGEMAVDAMLR